MSDLTPCNFCSLRQMKREAEKDGATVKTFVVQEPDPMAGWTAAQRSDRDGVGRYFMKLTSECAC